MVEPEKITDGVFRIAPGRSNCYLLVSDSLVLIDTGLPRDAAEVSSAIQTLGRSVSELSYILITHAHLDHIGSLAALQKTSSARVVAAAVETAYIEGLKKTWTMNREGVGGKIFKTILAIAEIFFLKYQPSRVDIPCKGNEMIDCFGGIQVIATPGHSPGSLSFYQKEKGLLFVGDALNGTGGFGLPKRFGCASYADALRSVENLVRLDFDFCLLGHGAPVVGNAKQQMALLLSHQKTPR